MYRVYGEARFERLARISIGHLHNLRQHKALYCFSARVALWQSLPTPYRTLGVQARCVDFRAGGFLFS